MKLVKRDVMLTLPEGTIYSHWEPRYSTGLYVHGGPCGVDWLEASLLPEPDAGHPNGDLDDYDKPVLNKGFGREGMFDPEQLYCVYEEADLNHLAEMLGMNF